jgi:prevent-host-death family protein
VTSVSIRDLRNHGGEILDSVMRGANVTVTRQGRPIAQLRPLMQGTDTVELLEHWRGTPTFALEDLRRDLAAVVDDSL